MNFSIELLKLINNKRIKSISLFTIHYVENETSFIDLYYIDKKVYVEVLFFWGFLHLFQYIIDKLFLKEN